MVEFDLTNLLTTKFQTAESSEKRLKLTFRDLTHFQIRLRTEQVSWIKFASKEYHDASKRPIIILTQVSWLDAFKPLLTILWTLYYLFIPPLKVPIFGAVLAAVIHKTRKYTWPLMNFILTYPFSQNNKIKKQSNNLTMTKPLSATSLPNLLNNRHGIKESESSLENGFSPHHHQQINNEESSSFRRSRAWIGN